MPTIQIFFKNNLVTCSVFLISCAVQTYLWFGPFLYVDSEYWTAAARQFAHGVLPPFSTFVAAHPATTILLPAAGLIISGVPSVYAIQITMIILISAAISIIVYLCREVRPQSLWWLGVAALLIPNPHYLKMTIPSALAALVACIYILLLLRTRERGSSRESFFWLGICAGFLLATRIDVGLEILLISLPYLWWHAGKKFFALLPIAALFFVTLNPFLWAGLGDYAASFMLQMNDHLAETIGFGYTISSAALPILSFLIGIAFLLLRPYLSSLPRDFLLWLVVSSSVLCGAVAISSYHPVRYFFPLIVIWEVLLPLFVFDILDRSRLSDTPRALRRVQYLLLFAFVAAPVISAYILIF
jgi:hypothetical protein